MSEVSENKSKTPYLLIIAVIIVIILAALFWPSEEEPEPIKEQPKPVQELPAEPEEPQNFDPAPQPEPMEVDPEAEAEPMPEYQADPEPLDTTDEGVEKALSSFSSSDQVNNLLMNEGLIQRFVVTVTNLANDEMVAIPQQPLAAPEQEFRIYKQADKEWIDAASYKRYTPYVSFMESFDNDALITLFDRYKDDIQTKYDEIGEPGKPFSEVLTSAIDTLLDTPEVPIPVEVYSDSVAYKYADPQLESLSKPQKQLLRTGPDNMRRIKAKLRELKDVIQQQAE